MESSQVVATSNPDEMRILEEVKGLLRQFIGMKCGTDDLQRRLGLLRDLFMTSISAAGPEVTLNWNATLASSVAPADPLLKEELGMALRVSPATTIKSFITFKDPLLVRTSSTNQAPVFLTGCSAFNHTQRVF
jgi:hypothetical protein